MKQKRNGFTLIEVMMVVGIMVLLAVVAFVNLSSNRNEGSVSTAASQIVALAREAQSNAVSQVQDATWGIHFENPTSTAPFYALFEGSTYSTTSSLGKYPLPTGVGYSLDSGEAINVTFAPISGAASASTSITIYSLEQSSYADTISISSLGLISYASIPSWYTWVVDASNNRVEEFNSAGSYLGQIGCNSGRCTNGSLSSPEGVAINTGGYIWVADATNRIQEFVSGGGGEDVVGQIGCTSGACSATSANGGFNNPQGVAIDGSGNIWVVDNNNNRVEEFNSAGTYLGQIGCSSGGCTVTSTNGAFNGPTGIAIDASGNIWVTDTGGNRVEEFNSAEAYLNQLGCTSGACTATSTKGGFNAPAAITVDPSGNVWVDDNGNNRLEEFTSAGTFLGVYGCNFIGVCGYGDANGGFSFTTSTVNGIAIDGGGNIWVADTGNERVEQLNPAGTYLGQIGCASGECLPGQGSQSGHFAEPTWVAIQTFVASGTGGGTSGF